MYAFLTGTIDEKDENLDKLYNEINRTIYNISTNNVILEENIKNTLMNIESLSSEFNKTSKNINNDLPAVTKSSKKILQNIDDITSGISTSMKQPFGGIRLLFGKTINKCP